MQKFAEFKSGVLICQRIRRRHQRFQYRFVNLAEVLSPAQLSFLESKDYTMRPHPRNGLYRSSQDNRFELFVDNNVLTERDDTIISLLFDSSDFR